MPTTQSPSADELVLAIAAEPETATDSAIAAKIGATRQAVTSVRKRRAAEIAEVRRRKGAQDRLRHVGNAVDRALNDPVNKSLAHRKDFIVEVLSPEGDQLRWSVLLGRPDLMAAKRACAGSLARLTVVAARIVHKGEVVHTPGGIRRRGNDPDAFVQVEHGVYRRGADGAVLRKSYDALTAKASWAFEGVGRLNGKTYKSKKEALSAERGDQWTEADATPTDDGDLPS